MTKTEIERQQITECMQFFKKNKLDINNTYMLQKLQNYIKRIVQLEVTELGYIYNLNDNENKNTFQLNFDDSKEILYHIFVSPINYKNGKIIKDTPTITFSTQLIYKDLDSEDENTRLTKCKQIFFGVFHELQHVRQNLIIEQNVSSNLALKYARDFCLLKYLKKFYFANYENYFIENDANEIAYEQIFKILDSKSSLYFHLKEKEIEKKSFAKYDINDNSKDSQTHYKSFGMQEKDDITIPIIDDLICRKGHIEILQLYPILQKEYNFDGTKKTIIELVNNMKNEIEKINQNSSLSENEKKILIQDGKDMYYGLIYNQIENMPEQVSELVMQNGKLETQRILKEIFEYFKREKEFRLNNLIIDSPYLKQSWDKKYIRFSKKLDRYYFRKNFVIKKVSDIVSSFDPKKENEQILKTKLHSKIKPPRKKVKIQTINNCEKIEDNSLSDALEK